MKNWNPLSTFTCGEFMKVNLTVTSRDLSKEIESEFNLGNLNSIWILKLKVNLIWKLNYRVIIKVNLIWKLKSSSTFTCGEFMKVNLTVTLKAWVESKYVDPALAISWFENPVYDVLEGRLKGRLKDVSRIVVRNLVVTKYLKDCLHFTQFNCHLIKKLPNLI